MQQNADITYYLITQFIGLVILAVVMILFILFMQKIANKLAKQIETQTSELNALNKNYQDSQQVLVSLYTNSEELSAEIAELTKKLTSLQQELSLLSSDYSDNKQVTQAIELARKGSSTKLIVEKTGLSTEEADAIVKFHGDKSLK